MSDCIILINSCDKHSEAWTPFLFLLRKYWRECSYDIYLNTELKKCDDEKVITINNDETNWGKRLYKCLEQIDCEYVLCFLEDFFLENRVNDEAFKLCLNRMQNNSNIGVFYFNKISVNIELASEYENFFKMNGESSSMYMLNCQVGLWRKDLLMAAAKTSSNPWEFEIEGFTHLDEKWRKMDFYCQSNRNSSKVIWDDKYVFPYLYRIEEGMGIARSRWLWKNKKFFKKEGVICNCDTLESLSHIKYICEEIVRNIKSIYK